MAILSEAARQPQAKSHTMAKTDATPKAKPKAAAKARARATEIGEADPDDETVVPHLVEAHICEHCASHLYVRV